MWTRIRRRLVRDRDAGPARRRPGDLVRVLVATALVALLTWHAYHPTATEQSIEDFFRSIPDEARTLVKLLYDLVSLWAIGIAAAAALLVRRRHLARDVIAAGALAWVVGRLLAFVTRQTDLWGAFKVTFDLSDAPRYPAVRIAVAVAVIAVAAPYLSRPVRRVGQALVLVLALTVMYLGRGEIADVLAAFFLGWGAAALVHYAFGTPLGRPAPAQVRRVLEHFGVPVDDIRGDDGRRVERALLRADGPAGPLEIVAIGRDEADAQFLARAWRYFAYRDAAPTLFPTRRQQVEYEAYVLLLAAQDGVAVPRVLVAGEHDGVAVLALAAPAGTPLAEFAREHSVGDALLEGIWTEAAHLRNARIAHGRLDADHFSVAGDGSSVEVVGWDRAVAGASDRQLENDLAQLLAATASLVGDERAIAVARKTTEPEFLAAALPWLQSAAVAWVTRDAFDAGDGTDARLETLRTDTASALGVDSPALTQRQRVNPRRVLMSVAILVAVGVLLSRVGDPVEFWNTIRDASWGYVALAFVFGVLTDVSFAFAFLGTLPELTPVWPTIELQSSLSFANLAIPIAADAAMQVRFLQKNGYELSEAVAAGGVLSSVSEIVVQAALFGVALLLAPDSIHFGRIDTTQIVVVVLGVILLVGVATALVLGVRRIRRIVLPPVLQALRTLWGAVKKPSRIGLMVGGNVAAQCFYACSLLACLAAFGNPVDFWTLVALNIGISLIASLVPVPGGGTAVSAIGLTGMLVTLGVPSASATAAVLSHQLAVTYLPAIPGWFASNDLVRRKML